MIEIGELCIRNIAGCVCHYISAPAYNLSQCGSSDISRAEKFHFHVNPTFGIKTVLSVSHRPT